MDIITLQLGLPRFPRCAYLVKDLVSAERFLRNAFVFKGVHWEKLIGLMARARSPELWQEVTDSQVLPERFFQEIYPYTLVPFSTFPTPRGHRIKVNELERLNPAPPGPKVRRPRPPWYGPGWPTAPHAILFEAMGRMGVKVESKMYESPCLTCMKLFEHVAGACSLVKRGTRGDLSLCHMDLVSSSGSISGGEDTSHPSTQPLPPID